MNDLVSIIMPSYNTAQYISDSIDSVLAQTYENWELIIVDDCSTDNTDEVISKYLSDGRIKYFKNGTNSGAAVSRNTALREANGRWIAFLDSDDLWHPEKLEKQLAFMEENGFSFSYTNYFTIDENSNSLNTEVTGPKRISKTGMYNYCWPGCLTVMYDSNVVGLVQSPDIKKNNDYSMWLKVIEKADCYLLSECLAKYRKRANSISNHGYFKLIKWHYKLFREACKKGVFVSLILTLRNLFFGTYKKLKYVRTLEK
ncbi:MAG: glycosyltransferase family 2 protein [Oscillospiraceae bacterium]|nr:glycosyltransferase family 2 protein [Oscillospiraceae bacterium]